MILPHVYSPKLSLLILHYNGTQIDWKRLERHLCRLTIQTTLVVHLNGTTTDWGKLEEELCGLATKFRNASDREMSVSFLLNQDADRHLSASGGLSGHFPNLCNVASVKLYEYTTKSWKTLKKTRLDV